MGLRLRPGVSTTDTAYGTVLLDERSGDYWQLNPTAALALRLLADGRTAEQAAAAMAEEFDVDEPRALRDVTALVGQLRAAGLVRP
ncbi:MULTISPECIES: lasso peptide biosynthesis PqqD family chaperone [Actinomadura]|uniref:Lasso peptide biosynthesis PqqD family chaperone n=1 Tax=Actinomadura litoris TaxID=2678616 RepID=A0A7K1L4S8_9ACTN|nr:MULTISPECIES: lasso peptide biosynthesis PqqD family chaperone [Actinomadura]MBT2209918.1 lasso peptide biosynthesis PqqD family chaperone [Actinomadura sp. NEAU-AAG7]MUN39255.1 lasso peptide biosynthesis PqqD family chaperone [Actinomadura litoris]